MRYLLVNTAPGPRGVQTAAGGVIMVHPSMDGAINGIEAELTDDEVEMAESAGLELRDVIGSGISGLQSSDIPAEGQVNPNTQDGADAIVGAQRAAAKRFAAADKAAGASGAKSADSAPAKGATPTPPKTPDGSTTDVSGTDDGKGNKS